MAGNRDPAERIIALIDMDCFYCQVEQRDQPELWGKPVAVVQYNGWQDGGLIAVNYEARPFGVKRNGMRGKEAKQKCPDLNLVSVPTQRGKANLTKYRNASAEVFRVLNGYDSDIIVERASIDEAFLDLSKVCEKMLEDSGEESELDIDDFPTTHVILEPPEEKPGVAESREEKLSRWLKVDCRIEQQIRRLAFGAEIVEKIRKEVLDKTQFHCSAGISNNKMVAKLICAFNKPRQQTICPCYEIPNLLKETPIQKVRGFGGKLGRSLCESYSIQMMSQLKEIPLETLQKDFGHKTATWLREMGMGMDREEVKARDLPKSIACSKNFPGKSALKTKEEVKQWLGSLAEELEERCKADQDMNNRSARTFAVGATSNLKNAWAPRGDDVKQFSRQLPMTTYEAAELTKLAFSILSEFNQSPKSSATWSPPLTGLFMTATRFEDSVDVKCHAITDFFSVAPVAQDAEAKIGEMVEIPRSPDGVCTLLEGKNLAGNYEITTVCAPTTSNCSDSEAPCCPEQNPVVNCAMAEEAGTLCQLTSNEEEDNQPGPSTIIRSRSPTPTLFDDDEPIVEDLGIFENETNRAGSEEEMKGANSEVEHESNYPEIVNDTGEQLEGDELRILQHLPDDFKDIRPEIFRNLPFFVQVEIRNFYKVDIRGEAISRESGSKSSPSKVKNVGVQKRNNATKKGAKKESSLAGSGGKNRSILEYYSKK